MKKLHITIVGSSITSSWQTLQQLIRELLNIEGRLTRIHRNDGNCNYHDKGDYTLTFTPNIGDDTIIFLSVNEN